MCSRELADMGSEGNRLEDWKPNLPLDGVQSPLMAVKRIGVTVEEQTFPRLKQLYHQQQQNRDGQDTLAHTSFPSGPPLIS